MAKQLVKFGLLLCRRRPGFLLCWSLCCRPWLALLCLHGSAGSGVELWHHEALLEPVRADAKKTDPSMGVTCSGLLVKGLKPSACLPPDVLAPLPLPLWRAAFLSSFRLLTANMLPEPLRGLCSPLASSSSFLSLNGSWGACLPEPPIRPLPLPPLPRLCRILTRLRFHTEASTHLAAHASQIMPRNVGVVSGLPTQAAGKYHQWKTTHASLQRLLPRLKRLTALGSRRRRAWAAGQLQVTRKLRSLD